MALTPSTMLPLGTQAPAFELPDVVSGERISLESFRDRQGLLVMFICRHCPFVKHVQDELAAIGKDYSNSNLGIVAISANSVETHPQDGPEKLKEMVQEVGFSFPLCYDETQEVAKAYTAACTPDFFLFDADRKLVYRGQLDDSRPSSSVPVTGKDLRGAIDAVLAGKPVSEAQKPSVGCNIKWKPGNEPPYFGAASTSAVAHTRSLDDPTSN
ncbi:thioredoxin family protein [Phormidium sp. CCY1219]|uniref:thioredoxin family protein n=1 Tax=Phormidium sp. CCY1219 TaxID=2886104 RepID=UPI002D1F55AA|nr:thioredoxin family protein [Phormidium sp. CCY1219]MEB3828739.1 thioredoxin family protein [Phormidium sp. CCY1219]